MKAARFVIGVTKHGAVPKPNRARGGAAIVPMLYTIVILYLAVTRDAIYWLIDVGPYRLKAHHIAAFTVHVVLMWLWARRRARSKWLQFLIPILACFTFGVAIETLQGILPYRKARTQDLVDNSIGIALGYILIFASLVVHKMVSRTARRTGGKKHGADDAILPPTES